MFSGIDPDLWRKVEKNPIVLLDRIPIKIQSAEKNKSFLDKLNKVEARFNEYMQGRKSCRVPVLLISAWNTA